jgi:hypothetical protein
VDVDAVGLSTGVTQPHQADREVWTMGERFLEMIARADPTKNCSADVLLDTNVALEIYSVGDLLRVSDECGHVAGRAPLARVQVPAVARAALHDRRVDQFHKVAPLVLPRADGTSYIFTTAIIHVVMSFVVGGRIGALTNVNHLGGRHSRCQRRGSAAACP